MYRADVVMRRPQFSWTRIKGEYDVEGGGGHGEVDPVSCPDNGVHLSVHPPCGRTLTACVAR